MEGADRVPAVGPVLLVGNHIATCDPPLVGAQLDRTDVYSMAKSEAFATWWGRFFIEGYHGFPVVRHSADRTALRRALGYLAGGHVVVVYPEGSRSPDHRLRRPYPGIGFLARRSRAPIVPAAIWGSERVLPKGRWVPRPAEVHIVFGQPFSVLDLAAPADSSTNRGIADAIMARVAALLPAEYRGVFVEAAVAPPAA